MTDTHRGHLSRPVALLTRWAGSMAVVLSLLYVLTTALPGDAADTIAGADRAGAEVLRQQLGLDRPLPSQLGHWWSAALRGDLGTSLVDGTPVLTTALDRFGATLTIAVPAILIAVVAGAVLALAQAWLRGRRSGTLTAAGVAVLAGVPEVVLVVGLVLMLAVHWQLVPPVSLPPLSGPLWAKPRILLLPIVSLALPATAWGARMLRGSVDDLLTRHVVTSARRRGVPAHRVITRHVLPRWRGPLAQTSAFLAAGILGGSAVVETMLAYPGLGQALASAVASRDIPMVQGIGCIVVAVTLTLLTLADLLTPPNEETTR